MPTILIKKNDVSGNVPTTSQLTNLAGGVEIAVNTADKRMFAMNSSSAVVELGINPTSLSIANNASINILTAATLTLSAPLGISSGGTGQSGTPTNGQVLIGNGTTFTRSTLTAGTGITVTNATGSITIAASGGGGAQDFIVQSYGIV